MAAAQFIKFEKELLRIKTVVNKISNVKLEMTGNLKILYRYMFDRYLFFNGLGNELYDNQDDIAESLAMTRRTIISLIKSLVSVGLVQKKTSRYSGANNSNAYVVQDILDKSKFEIHGLVCSVQNVVSNTVQDDLDEEEF